MNKGILNGRIESPESYENPAFPETSCASRINKIRGGKLDKPEASHNFLKIYELWRTKSFPSWSICIVVTQSGGRCTRSFKSWLCGFFFIYVDLTFCFFLIISSRSLIDFPLNRNWQDISIIVNTSLPKSNEPRQLISLVYPHHLHFRGTKDLSFSSQYIMFWWSITSAAWEYRNILKGCAEKLQ